MKGLVPLGVKLGVKLSPAAHCQMAKPSTALLLSNVLPLNQKIKNKKNFLK